MAFLVRKISRAKWVPKDDLAPSGIAADAVTADLRTTGNTLSFWRCSSTDKADIESAALALAAAADRPDRLDVVYLDEQVVRDKGLVTESTPGDTPVVSLRDHHVDILKLDLERLGAVARLVAVAHRSNHSHRMTKNEVVELVAAAIREGLLRLEDLNGEMRAKVEAKVKEAT